MRAFKGVAFFNSLKSEYQQSPSLMLVVFTFLMLWQDLSKVGVTTGPLLCLREFACRYSEFYDQLFHHLLKVSVQTF
ncbi:hypothetical protein DM586_21600 [Vibrio fluvialis]|nr:hypothetical protein DM586_21600 [Vibrio fluvialis]